MKVQDLYSAASEICLIPESPDQPSSSSQGTPTNSSSSQGGSGQDLTVRGSAFYQMECNSSYYYTHKFLSQPPIRELEGFCKVFIIYICNLPVYWQILLVPSLTRGSHYQSQFYTVLLLCRCNWGTPPPSSRTVERFQFRDTKRKSLFEMWNDPYSCFPPKLV